MPVRQLFSPASIPGLAHDHDYAKLTMEDDFLEKIGVTRISKEEAITVELCTRGQASSKRWHEERHLRLTSSHFSEICKATEKKNMVSLAESLATSKDLKTAPILHGRKYETVAVEQFEHLTGLKTAKCGLFVCLLHPFLAASPDRVISEDSIVEIKCPYTAKDREISSVTVPYLKPANMDSTELTLDKNHMYYFQVQGQLLCSRRKYCHFVVFTLRDLKVVRVPFDQPFVDSMVAKLKRFFGNHFREVVLNKHFYRHYNNYYE